MARYHRLALIFSVCFLLSLLNALTVSLQSWGAEDNRIGVVLAVDGTAEVKSPSAPSWGVLKFRDHLFLNDRVRTSASSKIKILMRNDSIMTLAENSEMHLGEFLLNDSQHRSIISLIVGKIRVITTKIFGQRDAMEVRTPNTTAGLRGSEKYVSYDDKTNQTEVFCVSGYCYVHPHDDPSQHLRIPVGHIVQYDGVRFPSATREATAHERRIAAVGVTLTEHDPREILPTTELNKEKNGPPRTRPGRPVPHERVPRLGPQGRHEPPGQHESGGRESGARGPDQPDHRGPPGPELRHPEPPPRHRGKLGLGRGPISGPRGGSSGPGPELITPDTSPARPKPRR